MFESSPTTRVDFDPQNRTSTIEIVARSHESLDRLAGLCDPRAWPRMRRFFYRAVPVERRAERWVEVRRVEPLGHSWSGRLREEVRCHIGLLPVEFCNVLDIDYRVLRDENDSVREVVLGFDLVECVHSRIGLSFMRGGLDHDAGFLRVTPAEGGAAIHSVKRVHFTGRRLAFVPRAVTEALMNVLATRNVGSWLEYVVDDGSRRSPKADNGRAHLARDLDRFLTRAVAAARGILLPPAR